MSFSQQFPRLVAAPTPRARQLRALLEPCRAAELEARAHRAHHATLRHFGRTMRLFAPLYLSNECVNNCTYCGFSRDNPILRVTLSVPQVVAEARALWDQGHRHVLLVAGEHPKFVSSGYLQDCVRAIRAFMPTVAIEVGPMEDDQYAQLVAAGTEGLVVYQETYQRETYAELHTAGPKKNFDWRLDCPERAIAGGFRRIGLGALFGLQEDWRAEAFALALHLEYLLQRGWKAHYTVSFPRMRPHAGGWPPRLELADRDYVQLVTAFRLAFPQVGIVQSTREPAALRDALVRLGITSMSAGSHTEPGGYTGAGKDDVHLTVKGRRVELDGHFPLVVVSEDQPTPATGQFSIDDHRSPAAVAAMLRAQGYDPVWKDWDEAILNPEIHLPAAPAR